METSIFDGTILAKVLNFNGKLKFVIPHVSDRKLFDQRDIGGMNDLEKILYTLVVLKDREVKSIILNLFGESWIKMSRKQYEHAGYELLHLEENALCLQKYNTLSTEADCLNRVMWELIKSRFPEITEPWLGLRHDYKIVAGYTEEGASKIYKNSLIGNFNEKQIHLT